MHTAAGGGITPQLVDDVCAQLGVSPHMFRQLFPSQEAFLDEINESLVEECASRLKAGVSQFRPSGDGDPLVQASVAMADSWPLTRSGILIRASRRVRALENPDDGRNIAEAERRYVVALLDTFADLMVRLDRTFTWSPILAVRVILDTYERSFEMWIIGGHEESEFGSSPYVLGTLPALLREMSEPLSAEAATIVGA